MRNKALLLLTGVVLLSGCERKISSESSELSSSLPTVYCGDCPSHSDGDIGFATAVICQEGVISMDDTLTFNVFYGRAKEEIHPEIYDRYQGCDFYLEERLAWCYHDKRGDGEIECASNVIRDAARFDLPNLMEDEYQFTKNGLNTVISHYVTVTLDLKPYHDYFYDAKGWRWHVPEDDSEDLIEESVEVELAKVEFSVYFLIHSVKNGEEQPLGSAFTDFSWPEADLEDDVLTLHIGKPKPLPEGVSE